MKHAERISAGAAPYLEPGEQVLAACIAQPKGRTRAIAGGGGIVREAGLRQQRAVDEAAAGAGLVVEAPMALAVTDRRLLTLKISTPVLGRGGEVKALLSALPLAGVDGLETKRVGLGQRIVIRAAGEEVQLEAAAGGKEIAAAYASVGTRSR